MRLIFASLIYAIALIGPGVVRAAVIDESLLLFQGQEFSPGALYPRPPVTVGTYISIPAGEVLVSGTISGTFGNALINNTACNRLYLGDGGDPSNDLLVAQCGLADDCWKAGDGLPDPWSHTFDSAEIDVLKNFPGPLVLSTVQDAAYIVQLGPTRLVATTVPEPPALTILFGTALAFIDLLRRKLRQEKQKRQQ